MPSGQSATAEDFGFSVEVGYITNKEEK
jgi:hypothetical protein